MKENTPQKLPKTLPKKRAHQHSFKCLLTENPRCMKMNLSEQLPTNEDSGQGKEESI